MCLGSGCQKGSGRENLFPRPAETATTEKVFGKPFQGRISPNVRNAASVGLGAGPTGENGFFRAGHGLDEGFVVEAGKGREEGGEFFVTTGTLGDGATALGVVQDPKHIGEEGAVASGVDFDLLEVVPIDLLRGVIRPVADDRGGGETEDVIPLGRQGRR